MIKSADSAVESPSIYFVCAFATRVFLSGVLQDCYLS